jgi:hypothetical protein
MKKLSVLLGVVVCMTVICLGWPKITAFGSNGQTSSDPVQGKGKIITFSQDILVPKNSTGATNIRTEPIKLATYKQLSFLEGIGPAQGNGLVSEETRNKVNISVVFFEEGGSRIRAESSLTLSKNFWGVSLNDRSSQIWVPAPLGRVEIENISNEDVKVTVKAYATE